MNREIGTKRNKFGIPVVVIDLNTKESFKYMSIAEAARSFNTHPKTIWRIVYNNKLYLNRYQIIEYNKGKGLRKRYYINTFFKYIYKYFYNIFKVKSNRLFIYRILLFILLIILIYIFILYLIAFFKDMYGQYIFTLREGKANYIKLILEHKLNLNYGLNNTNIVFKDNSLIHYKEWRYEYIFKNEWTSIYSNNSKLGIYQSIINEINLDFKIKGTDTFSGLNSSYSSPVIERVNINSIFSNAIASTNIVNDTTNSLGIQSITNSNRNFVIVDNALINTRLRTTELLNYQSNILYCLINGLSPSIY